MAKFVLAAVLKKKKLSKRKFAQMIDMRYDQVFRVFRDGYDPKLSFLNRASKALKCKVKDLLKE